MASIGLMRGDFSLGEIVGTVLEDDGHSVVTVSLEVSKAAVLSTLRLDLVVMEGYPPEAVVANVRALRARTETADTPIVVLATKALEDLLSRQGLEREVHELPMPFDIGQLANEVRRLVGEDSAQEAK